MEKIEIKECHKYLLQIAKVFHEICARHNIPYYMIGGTMLGAIRHHGFIPWDDDMDFGVPRKYYKILMNVLDEELPSEYRVLSIYKSNRFSNGFIKVEDTRTLIKERGKAKMAMGINIDIFPIDYTNGNKGLLSKNNLITILTKFESYCFADLEGLSCPRMITNKILRSLLFFVSNKNIFNYIENHLLLTVGDYLVNHYGVYATKEIVRKEIFGTPRLYGFEDTELFGVERYDDYLRHFYNNYMQMPQSKDYHFHIEELYLNAT